MFRVKGFRWSWFRWVLVGALVALLAAEAAYLWPTLHESWRALTEIHWGWVAACIGVQLVSLAGFGAVQQRLLAAGGLRISHPKSTSVVFASTAMAVTLPAGQVFSTAFTYKQTRKWGATPVVASWQLAVSGVISTASLAALGGIGAIAVGTRVSPVTLLLTAAGALALFFLLRYVSQNPDSLDRVGRWVLGRYNALRGNDPDHGMAAWHAVLEQLESVELRRRDSAIAFGWSAVHRVADLACLGFACWAIGAQPSFAGLLISFAAAKAVASVPLAPGGLGFVDGALIATLTAAGTTAPQALAAVFVYRIASYILVAVAGWLVFFVLYRSTHRDDEAIELEYGRGVEPFPRRKRTPTSGRQDVRDVPDESARHDIRDESSGIPATE
ncbi:YbhN family protein [Rhodococcus sp. HNM0569]|uniref:lysylphosphatidylglycerol synthase transmembrane domain-containing protein n=1 Tax=Rhodococcus sp. HNM0569 TaxID=2716340 RepID=UPI00146DAE51|nr:YbhN family protein [Rhodococcus sp. HNM0569]NLU83716.1 UPF0104 family protein [Rhodococcus sp. HNM0569]